MIHKKRASSHAKQSTLFPICKHTHSLLWAHELISTVFLEQILKIYIKKKLHTLDNALWCSLGEYQQELILKSSNVTTRVAV